MKKIFFYSVSLTLIFMVSCTGKKSSKNETKLSAEELANYRQAAAMFAVLPAEAPNPENQLTPEKVALGKALYYDNRLSKDQTQSCNTCHNLETYGVDNEPTSEGDNGSLGTRNSPTTLNSAFHSAQFWDGRNKDVEEQAGGPILNPVEMAIPDEEFVVNRLKGVEEYQRMFAAAYPEEEDPVTYKNLTWAIGAFERTLITPSKFDKYLAGDDNALTKEELKGMKTYVDVGCATCHSGALLGGTLFMKFGLTVNYWDYTHSAVIDSGKYVETRNPADMFVFKSMPLRNIEKTHPYFHDGSVAGLEDAVQIMAQTELNKELTEGQVNEITVFLKTLTGEVPESALLTQAP
ncbi:MAG: cytochrome-c peroxidase [Bacteroidota bacterium]